MAGRVRDSKQLILEAARREFAERGFAGARVARIAAQAGVNKQLIFYYFGSKGELYRAVAEDEAAVGIDPGGLDGPGTERVRAAVRRVFEALCERPALVQSLTEPPATSGTRTEAATALATLEDDLARVISDGQGLGYFRDDVVPATAARQALALCIGYLALEPRLRSPDRARWLDETTAALLRILAW